MQQAITRGEAAPTDVVIERDRERMTLTVTPVMQERPVVDAEGNPVMDGDD